MKTVFGTSISWILVMASLAYGASWAGDLPRTSPQEVGFSSERLHAIDDFYADRVRKGEMAGIVLLIARHGQVAHLSATGYSNVATHQPMKTDTLFRWYSMTKPITAVALMTLYEEGRFQLGDPISKYIPDFLHSRVLKAPSSDIDDTVPVEFPATIHDLLRHTAGFNHCLGPDAISKQCTQANVFGTGVALKEMIGRIAKIPLQHQPGTTWEYSIAPDVEARLVEIISGMSFEDFLKERLFKPLQMNSTSFDLTSEECMRLAAVHWMKDGKVVPWDDVRGHPSAYESSKGHAAQPWDSTAKECPQRKLVRGSLGLIGTASDYWRFAQMIANGGELDSVRVLSPQVVRFMTRDHLASIDSTRLSSINPGTGFGLGFAVSTDAAAQGFPNSEGSIWWDGAGTTLWWADPREGLVAVAMAQYLDTKGPNIQELRPQLRALVYGAMQSAH